jgi:hypothetical protein
MAAITLKCDIDGCGLSWSVPFATKMRPSVEDHRRTHHPGWVEPPLRPMTPYRLDYSGRGRQF